MTITSLHVQRMYEIFPGDEKYIIYVVYKRLLLHDIVIQHREYSGAMYVTLRQGTITCMQSYSLVYISNLLRDILHISWEVVVIIREYVAAEV